MSREKPKSKVKTPLTNLVGRQVLLEQLDFGVGKLHSFRAAEFDFGGGRRRRDCGHRQVESRHTVVTEEALAHQLKKNITMNDSANIIV
jgi:hypothetical protein